MPKRKLCELEEGDDVSGTVQTPPSSTPPCDGHETTTTASPASPTECAPGSCLPDMEVDSSAPGCSTDEPSTSTQEEFTQLRKKRKSVKFNGVTVYYFPRKQGFICVPSQGGSTLGMSERHMQTEKYTVNEYAKAQRRLHKQILREQQKAAGIPTKRNTRQKSDDSASVTSDTSSDSDDDLNVDEYYFLQPVPTRQRRILLRQSGIKKIDTVEKEECRDIRSSREMCGCDCRVYCDPETCTCSIAGIKCQVDRLSFPCGCSKDGCSNPVGRIEFNPIRVRTHFIHTVMRIEMDRKREQITQMCAPRSVSCEHEQVTYDNEITNNDEIENSEENTQEETGECERGSSSAEKSDEDSVDSSFDGDIKNKMQANTSNSPSNVPKSPKSCLKRRPSNDPKNGRDVTQYNSNDRGSCRDCGNTDVTEMLMAGAHFVESTSPLEMEPIIPSQTKIIDCTGNATGDAGCRDDPGSQQQGSSGSQQQHNYQQVMLFDGEEEEYVGENGNMYNFKPEDSSYSESSDPDCCSEGSDDGVQQQATSTQFNNCANSADRGSTTASHYCIPETTYQASTAQPEQKYMDLNSSTSGYKLEPISEILNPLRFAGYDSNNLAQQSWHAANSASFSYNESSAGGLPRYPARYPSMQQQHPNGSQSVGSTVGSQGFYNGTDQPPASNMVPYQHQSTVHQANSSNATYHDNGPLPCIPTPQNLTSKSCDLPFNQTEGSVVKDTDEDSGFKDLSASSSTASSPVKDDDDVTLKYHDLSSSASVTTSSQFTDLSATPLTNNISDTTSCSPKPATTVITTVKSDDDTNCRYTTLLSPTRHGPCDSSSQAADGPESINPKPREGTNPANADTLYQELDEEYILPKRNSVVAVSTDTINSSPINQNEIKNSTIKGQFETADNIVSSLTDQQNDSKSKLRDEPSSNKEAQNFGEIIKESIVETVSA